MHVVLYLLGDRCLTGFSPVSCPCELPVSIDDTNFTQSPRFQLFPLLWAWSSISTFWASYMLLSPSTCLHSPPCLASPVPLVSNSTSKLNWTSATTRGPLWGLPGQSPKLNSFFPAFPLEPPLLSAVITQMSTPVASKTTDHLILQ